MTDAVLLPTDAVADRAEWTTPEVVVMTAGSAENQAGRRSDDPINRS